MPRDYDLHGLQYSSLVTSAHAWYLTGQNELNLLPDDIRVGAERDLADISAIFDARATRIHEPVRWGRVDGLVCTCSLILRSAARLRTPLGHLDPVRWTLATVVVVRLHLGTKGLMAACQTCGSRNEFTLESDAHGWCLGHSCPPGIPVDDDFEELRTIESLPGESFDDAVHWSRVLGRASRFGTATFDLP